MNTHPFSIPHLIILLSILLCGYARADDQSASFFEYGLGISSINTVTDPDADWEVKDGRLTSLASDLVFAHSGGSYWNTFHLEFHSDTSLIPFLNSVSETEEKQQVDRFNAEIGKKAGLPFIHYSRQIMQGKAEVLTAGTVFNGAVPLAPGDTFDISFLKQNFYISWKTGDDLDPDEDDPKELIRYYKPGATFIEFGIGWALGTFRGTETKGAQEQITEKTYGSFLWLYEQKGGFKENWFYYVDISNTIGPMFEVKLLYGLGWHKRWEENILQITFGQGLWLLPVFETDHFTKAEIAGAGTLTAKFTLNF